MDPPMVALSSSTRTVLRRGAALVACRARLVVLTVDGVVSPGFAGAVGYRCRGDAFAGSCLTSYRMSIRSISLSQRRRDACRGED